MTDHKEVLRLHSLGINNTRIVEICGCARSTVISALQKAATADLSWDAVKNLSLEEAARKLYPATSMGQQYKSVKSPGGKNISKWKCPSLKGYLHLENSCYWATLSSSGALARVRFSAWCSSDTARGGGLLKHPCEISIGIRAGVLSCLNQGGDRSGAGHHRECWRIGNFL